MDGRGVFVAVELDNDGSCAFADPKYDAHFGSELRAPVATKFSQSEPLTSHELFLIRLHRRPPHRDRDHDLALTSFRRQRKAPPGVEIRAGYGQI